VVLSVRVGHVARDRRLRTSSDAAPTASYGGPLYINMRPVPSLVFLLVGVALLLIALRAARATNVLPSSCRLTRNAGDLEVCICLTTIPPRLHNPWVWQNLASLRGMRGVGAVRVYVPYALASRPHEPIEVPRELQDVPGLEVVRCLDEGPLTKLAGPLQDALVPDDALLCIVDDDVAYVPCMFLHLIRSVTQAEAQGRPNAAHSFCSTAICGYRGFGGRKSSFLPLLRVERPEICFYVDDDFIDEALRIACVPVTSVPMHTAVHWCTMRVLPTVLGPQYLDGSGLIWSLGRHLRSQRGCREALSPLPSVCAADTEKSDAAATRPPL